MSSKKLYVTVGLPRAGKSTWAKKQNHPIVNRDSIRLALHGKAFISETEDLVRVIAQYMVKSLFLAGHDTVIVDETSITHSIRKRYLSPNWDTTYVLFPAEPETCIERAIESGREDLIPIIESMAKKIESQVIGEEEFIICKAEPER